MLKIERKEKEQKQVKTQPVETDAFGLREG